MQRVATILRSLRPTPRPGARRGQAWRTATLLAAIMVVVCGASYVVYHGGVQVMQQRADEELGYQIQSAHDRVGDRIAGMVNELEFVADSDEMLRILDRDVDSTIDRLLRRALDRSLLSELHCINGDGVVIAATDPHELGRVIEVSREVRTTVAEDGDTHFERGEDGFTLTAPVVWEEFDEPELLGYIRARGNFSRLLSDGGPAISRLVDEDGDLLAERREHRFRALETTAPGFEWGDPGLETRTARLDMPEGLTGPPLFVSIADRDPQLALETALLRRMALLLTSGTLGLVVTMVLVFARFEAKLNRRLEDRAIELEALNESLDRSRADLVKAARMAGMSEIATGILHNVGNVLNSVNVAAEQIRDTLTRSELGELRRLVDLFESGEGGLAMSIREHAKGPAFVRYLSALTKAIEKDHGTASDEVGSMRSGIEHIKALVSSQQQFAKQSSLPEETSLPELMDGALVISDQVLGPSTELTVERDFDSTPPVVVYRHRVMEILVNLINNARQSMRDAGIERPVLSLRIHGSSDHRALFEVTDNGVGIPPENLAQIFNHGFSTRPEGHGFGLHASINAAKELDGSILARSDGEGHGATFILHVPFQPTTSDAPVRSADPRA